MNARALMRLGSFAVLAAALAGCGKRETPVERATREGILLMANGTEPRSLDPQFVTSFEEYRIIMALFEGLVNADPVTLEPRPGVAERWDYDPATLTWTFHLRDNARWSNGDPVTAGDFAYAYRRILTPALGAEYAMMLYPIRGARDYHQGRTKDFAQVGVRAADDRTLQIQLENPTGHFLTLLYHQTYFPLHPPTIERYDAFERADSPWAREGKLVGNGPFNLARWAMGDRIDAVKSDTYWDAARVRLNGISFFPITSVGAEERAFRAGQLHITNSLPPTKVPVYRAEASPDLRVSPWYAVYYYILNVSKPPLDNPKVRLALNLALDRRLLAERVLQGGQEPAYNFTPASPGYKARAQLRESADEARRLLAEAGYPGGKGFPATELLYNTSDIHRPMAEAIQQMWSDHLGIQVKLVNTSAPEYFKRRREGNIQIARAGWIADYLDPLTFLELFASDNALNHSRWKSAGYDALLAAAGREGDAARRFELFQQAEALLAAEAPFIPLYYYARIYLIRPEVRGWENNVLDQHPYQNVWLDPAAAAAKTQ